MINEYGLNQANIFEKYEVVEYLAGVALFVNPKFRGLGIATEMLKARISLLETLGLNLTSAAFTTINSQNAAIKAGYSEDFKMRYNHFVFFYIIFYDIFADIQNLEKLNLSSTSQVRKQNFIKFYR